MTDAPETRTGNGQAKAQLLEAGDPRAHITVRNLDMAYGSFVIQRNLTLPFAGATSSSSWAAADAAKAPC